MTGKNVIEVLAYLSWARHSALKIPMFCVRSNFNNKFKFDRKKVRRKNECAVSKWKRMMMSMRLFRMVLVLIVHVYCGYCSRKRQTNMRDAWQTLFVCYNVPCRCSPPVDVDKEHFFQTRTAHFQHHKYQSKTTARRVMPVWILAGIRKVSPVSVVLSPSCWLVQLPTSCTLGSMKQYSPHPAGTIKSTYAPGNGSCCQFRMFMEIFSYPSRSAGVWLMKVALSLWPSTQRRTPPSILSGEFILYASYETWLIWWNCCMLCRTAPYVYFITWKTICRL